MATTISATSAGATNTEAAMIDEIDPTTTDAIEDVIDNLDTKALEDTLDKAGAEEGLSAVIKSFVEVITNLVTSLSKILEKLSAKASKSAKASTKKVTANTKNKAATKAKKEVAAAIKKAETATKAAETITTKTTAAPTVEALKPATAIEAAATTLAATTVSSTKINPEEGYFDDYLSISTNKQGAPEIFTEDGYTLRFEGKEQAWNIVTPDGKVNRIWGDPHMVESDGDTWDFKERSTFIFGNNKATIETVPYGNSQTLSSKVTIYNGDSRISVSGIDKNQPVFESLSRDAQVDDALRDDGDIFILGKENNGEDQFILLKDVGEKFDAQFAKQVGVGDMALRNKYLTNEQISFLK